MNTSNKNTASSILFWNNLLRIYETFDRESNKESLEQSQKQLDKNFARFEKVIEKGIRARNAR